MAEHAYDLPLDVCLAWMRDQQLVRADGKPDWKAMLRAAKLGETQFDSVPSRWRQGEARLQRIAIRDALEHMEAKRKTTTGSLVHALERWVKIGEQLSAEPSWLAEEISRLTAKAEEAQKRGEARRLLASPPGFASATPKPKGKRK